MAARQPRAGLALGRAASRAAAGPAKSPPGAAEKLNAKVAEDEARIAASTDAALAEIESVAADAAQDIVARLSGVKTTAAEARSAVKTVVANG